MFNTAVHKLIFVYSFLLDRILVFMVPRATVRTLKPKKPNNLTFFKVFFRFLPALITPQLKTSSELYNHYSCVHFHIAHLRNQKPVSRTFLR